MKFAVSTVEWLAELCGSHRSIHLFSMRERSSQCISLTQIVLQLSGFLFSRRWKDIKSKQLQNKAIPRQGAEEFDSEICIAGFIFL